jgi:hypothetical protein
VRRTSERSAALAELPEGLCRRCSGKQGDVHRQPAGGDAPTSCFNELRCGERSKGAVHEAGVPADRGAAPRAAAAGVAPGPRPQARQPWRSSLPRGEEGSLLPHGEEGVGNPPDGGPAPPVARSASSFFSRFAKTHDVAIDFF